MGTKETITIIGAGNMGTAIATLCSAHGYRVVLNDHSEKMLASFAKRATPLAQAIAGSKRTPREILAAVEPNSSLQDSVKNAFLVHEVIHEDLDAKRELFRQLDAICAPDVILATNTSSYLLSEICADIAGRERAIGIHYVSPAHLIRAVEIITAEFTGRAVIERSRAFIDSIDHVGIVCKERPGFLINKIQYALKAECQRIVEEGVASVGDIDAAVRLAIGPRLALWGPMMQEDLNASKRTVLAVTEYIHRMTGEVHYAGTDVLRSLAARGQTGASAGAGWYRWDPDYEKSVRERDRQLSELIEWLRTHESLAALGVRGENEQVWNGDSPAQPEV